LASSSHRLGKGSIKNGAETVILVQKAVGFGLKGVKSLLELLTGSEGNR
jgi:hypothetical protein